MRPGEIGKDGGSIKDILKQMFGAQAPGQTQDKVTEEEVKDAKRSLELYKILRGEKMSTVLKALAILSIQSCKFTDGLFDVLNNSHHAQHNGVYQEVQEVMGLLNMMDDMRKEGGPSGTNPGQVK